LGIVVDIQCAQTRQPDARRAVTPCGGEMRMRGVIRLPSYQIAQVIPIVLFRVEFNIFKFESFYRGGAYFFVASITIETEQRERDACCAVRKSGEGTRHDGTPRTASIFRNDTRLQ